MKKTYEEKYDAIMAEIDRTIRGNIGATKQYCSWMASENQGAHYVFHILSSGYIFPSDKNSFRRNAFLIDAIYAGMGLETSDAVEAERKISDEFLDRLKTDRARAAKLVEALGSISSHCDNVISDDGYALTDDGLGSDVAGIRETANVALEAYKKGGEKE